MRPQRPRFQEPPEPGGLPPRHRRPLVLALGITSIVLVVEAVGGVLTGSLALLADAGHMTSDVGALGLALLATWISRRAHTSRRTYGYLRVEVLAALANGVLLWVVAGYIFWEAAGRFASVPEVRSGPMVAVAAVGLIANLVSGVLLARAATDNINVRGALYHVLADAVGSVGAIVAGILMLTLGWYVMDPIMGVSIGVLILAGSSRLIWEAVNVLLGGSPSHVDLAELRRDIEAFPLVEGVHDIHTWTITSGYPPTSSWRSGARKPRPRRCWTTCGASSRTGTRSATSPFSWRGETRSAGKPTFPRCPAVGPMCPAVGPMCPAVGPRRPAAGISVRSKG